MRTDTPRSPSRGLAGAISVVLALGAVVITAAPAQAAPIPVTTEAELVAAAGVATSADEIVIQNDLALTAAVVFPTGTTIRGVTDSIVISRAVGAFDLFELAPTAVSQTFTISDLEFDGAVGTGSAIRAVDTAGSIRDLFLDNVDIHDFTAATGAAVHLEPLVFTSNLTVTGSEFTDNTATAGAGGAIGPDLNQASLTLTDTTFTDNTATGAGGAISVVHNGGFTTLTVTNVTATGNESTGADGGAFRFDGFSNTSTITNSTFENNTAAGNGGALGGVDLGFRLSLVNSTFTENVATAGSGGALYLDNVIDLEVNSGSTFTDNEAVLGGAIAAFTIGDDVDIADATFTGNSADDGGALALSTVSGSIFIDGTTFENNLTSSLLTSSGGALWSDGSGGQMRITQSDFLGNYGWNGGAIYLQPTAMDFTMSQSTFDSNSAGGDAVVPGFGAAVYIEEILAGGYARWFSSTFSNQNLQAGFGGIGVAAFIDTIAADGHFILGETTFYDPDQGFAIIGINDVEDTGTVEIQGSTFATTAGLVISDNLGDATIDHVILDTDRLNLGTASLFVGAGSNPWGVQWSILTDHPAATVIDDLAGNQFDTDPDLGPLQNNGGRTLTMKPIAGSSAIDMGDPTVNSGNSTPYDQRSIGFARVAGSRIDIGAVEVEQALLPSTGGTVSWWLLFVAGGALMLGAAALAIDRRARRRVFAG